MSRPWSRRVRRLLTVLLALILCTVLAAPGAADEPEIRVGVSVDFRPYAFADKNGRPVGYSVDLIQAVARTMGLRVQIKAGTWDQVWHGLAQGQIDVLAIVAKTPDRESQVDFSVPHTETFDAFFVRTGQPAIPNLAAAAGKEIVVRRSDAALKLLPRNFSGKLTFVDTIPQGLAMVAAGQHDAFLNSKLIGTLEMREYHIQGLTAGPPIPDYKRVFAFSVRKGDVELLEKLNQGLRIIKANGEYDRIYQRWLEVQPENRWQKMVPYLRWAIAAIVLLMVLAGGLQWLVRLRTRQLVRANEKITAEVTERRKAEAALQQANLTLEQRVAERTAKLQESEETLLRAARALGASERRLQLFIEHAPVALAMFDRQMCYLYASGRWLTDYGLQRRDLKGLSHYEVFPEIPEVWKEAHRRGLAGEVLRAEDGRFVRGDGSVQWLRWEIRPWHNDAGEIGGIVIFTEDITERKRAEEALLRSEKLASVGRMAASIAHEINNPLEAVTNTLYLAKTNLGEPQLARQYLGMADDELKRISHITRQTLGFYRESSTPTTVCVSSIMDSAVDLLRGKIRLKLANIKEQYDGDLQVAAVSSELRQVFSNLLANSLDAIDEKGTIKLRVSRSTCVASGQTRVRVTVADNGKGIDAATLPRIFEALFTTKEATGSGLGLWVSKQLIDRYGGSMRVRSSTHGARRGTVFSVFLPTEAVPLAKSAAASST